MAASPEGRWPVRFLRPAKRRGPLPIAECLSRTWAVIRSKGVPIYQAAVLGSVSGITMQVLAVTGRAPQELSGSALLGLFVVGLAMSALAEIVIVRLTTLGPKDTSMGLWKAYGFALTRLLPFLATAFIAALFTAAGLLLFIVPGLIAMGAFAFWRQAVTLEKGWGSIALARSAFLSLPALWRIVGILAVTGIIRLGFVDWAIVMAQVSGSQGLVAALDRYEILLEGVMLAVLAVRLVVDPVVLVFMTELYGELKATSDGWGLPVPASQDRQPESGGYDRDLPIE